MKNKTALYKLTHGMYILSTTGAACMVDAVCQISGGDNPLVSVAVMKKNYTNEIMHKNDKFALAIFGKDDDPSLIKHYGFQSMRDVNKFQGQNIGIENGVPYVKDTLAYLVLEKVDSIENDTHTVFIGRVVEGDVNKAGEAMTYGYYQEHKGELNKVTTEKGKTAWVCDVCGYVYYGETLPEGYTCPICGVDASHFKKQ